MTEQRSFNSRRRIAVGVSGKEICEAIVLHLKGNSNSAIQSELRATVAEKAKVTRDQVSRMIWWLCDKGVLQKEVIDAKNAIISIADLSKMPAFEGRQTGGRASKKTARPAKSPVTPPAFLMKTDNRELPVSIKDAVGELAQRVSRMLVAAIEPAIHDAVVAAAERAVTDAVKRASATLTEKKDEIGPLAAKVATVRPPKVAVIGLLPQQAGMLQAEFTSLDLRCPDKSLSGKQLRFAVSGCDAVFSITSFLSHADEAVLRESAHYVRVKGGMTSIRTALENFIANQRGAN